MDQEELDWFYVSTYQGERTKPFKALRESIEAGYRD